MKSIKHIVETTNQSNEKYLPVGENPVTCSSPHLVSTKKFSTWVYWKVFGYFWPIKLPDLSHVVLIAPIFLGIFFYHSFYGMTLKIYSNQGEGVYF